MREVWEQVEGKGFWIIHKSYIVNTAFVSVYHYDSDLIVSKLLPDLPADLHAIQLQKLDIQKT